MLRPVAERAIDDWRRLIDGRLPELFGIDVVEVEHGRCVLRLDVRSEFLAPNDYLHAGAIITLADTSCGFGSMASMPEGMGGFTTVELKTNFLRTAAEGAGLRSEATLVHGGRTTQVWDATVTREDDGKPIALFRATQYLIPAERSRP
jgi:1,4-dihydroxy-2-naphthoyl-CoA hydrolase